MIELQLVVVNDDFLGLQLVVMNEDKEGWRRPNMDALW